MSPLRGRLVLLADRIDRGIGRGLGGVGQAVEQVADRRLALFAADPKLIEALRSRITRGNVSRFRAVLHALGSRTYELGLGVGAGQQGRDQRSRGKAPGKRDERRLPERVGGAAASILIRADCALPRAFLFLREIDAALIVPF